MIRSLDRQCSGFMVNQSNIIRNLSSVVRHRLVYGTVTWFFLRGIRAWIRRWSETLRDQAYQVTSYDHEVDFLARISFVESSRPSDGSSTIKINKCSEETEWLLCCKRAFLCVVIGIETHSVLASSSLRPSQPGSRLGGSSSLLREVSIEKV